MQVAAHGGESGEAAAGGEGGVVGNLEVGCNHIGDQYSVDLALIWISIAIFTNQF